MRDFVRAFRARIFARHAGYLSKSVSIEIMMRMGRVGPLGRQAMTHTMNKVPQVTFAFWVMKISATTLGETGGDLLSMTLNLGYARRRD